MNELKSIKKDIYKPWLLLRITYSIGYLLAGFDKFLYISENWRLYLSNLKLLNIDLNLILYLIGLFEILIGIILLTKYVRQGAIVAAFWLLIKAVYNLLMGPYYDIALRYFVVAMGAIALAYICEIREKLK